MPSLAQASMSRRLHYWSRPPCRPGWATRDKCLLLLDRAQFRAVVLDRQVERDLVADLELVEHLGLRGKGHLHRRPLDFGNGTVIERDRASGLVDRCDRTG